ncbi:DUF1761 domain-containing protein [Actinophytocola xanthii]|uniref:DUF1761 domain-containing protein n=1 Tax=Actinophytocola xanthii TaxID=1912961 RepID=A0A1Q8CAB6_9PSEU|nr:DUF1761 domain-containing protein [Actinophytocola xanthii]OLF11321.1 hypothetical protein BU204_30345 [Actinophytocola xanthii]
MPELPWLAVLVGTAAAFVIGGGYYAVLATARTEDADLGTSSPLILLVELLRCLLLASAVTGLVAATDTATWWGGLLLGLALWVGFPLVLLLGAVVHERTPVRLAALHGGDWLLKLLVLGAMGGALTG